MLSMTLDKDRPQSRNEEMANSISHGLGVIASILGTPFLIIHAANTGNTGYLVGVSIFSATLIMLYLSSTLYHAMPAGKAKRILRAIDHSLIFLLIAGTYTPFTLGVLSGAWGWSLFGVVWGLAVIGIILKLFDGATRPIFYNTLYLLMGWVIVVAIHPLLNSLPLAGLLWLLAGGLLYTIGIIFYATDGKLPFGHLIWHLFVLGGSVSHYFAVYWYAA
ncbi:hemolysin III family protein [Thiomicrorhabdus sp. ZW0627]|uniref:PAQR family membrane homeostasis protein TrhA n=1 Tax=Thiomicrorhabdus sp. ZW0627 TaxID=3039774 RepID=UPI002436B93E|nr:hemolysin III family protein [Thiomicrorhabdus sp. ZW0627]MDG6773875.1 hemolysin III family protein [Thiomicrorhabdus sp. ZW0627]